MLQIQRKKHKSLKLCDLLINKVADLEKKTYNVKEWVAYGVQYAKDNGFNINEMGMLALFKAIDDWYGTKKEISQKDVEQILDAAIKRAKHKLGRKIVGIFKTKDKDDLQILKEADFNIK